MSFGGFGAPAQTSASASIGGFGFGSQQTATATAATNQAFGSAFGPSPSPLPTFSLNALTTAPAPFPTASSQVAGLTPQSSLDSRFLELPEAYRNVIEQTNTEYKKPMREGLDEIARYQPKLLDELKAELRKTSLAALRLGNQQDILLAEIRSFHEEAKHNLKDVRRFGVSGLQQIQSRGGVGARSYLMSEELPTEFYVDAANKIEGRLGNFIEEVQHISRQLSATLGAVSGEENQYGQQTRIGPQHLVRLIQRQSEAFARVAACVAEIHSQADEMRTSYLKIYGNNGNQRYPETHNGSDPFAAADRAEAANERLMSKKLRAEEFSRPSSDAALITNSTGLQQVAPLTSTSTPAFGFPAASAPAFGGGLGGVGNPFGGVSSALPTSTPAATFGFGAAPQQGFGATPAANAFGFGGGGTGFKALDLATANTSLGFGAVPTNTFGGGSTSSRKSGSKSRK